MKKLVIIIVSLILAASNAMAAHMYPATGRIVDEQGEAVSYATVVLLKDNQQVTGMTTSDDGRFTLKVPMGDYTLSVQFLGYEPIMQPVHVESDNDLGDLLLKSSATQLESVVVKAQMIRREADRFVVDVANAPAAVGKNGVELLENAPGVWVEDDKISINGKTGSKVYVNDRELRMDTEQLLAYLRSLRAEEIQKIEVVPTTGADYDADSAGGVIKITLKKRRENGTEGSVSLRSTQSNLISSYSPGANINIHSGRLDLNASAWGYISRENSYSDETTAYSTQDAALKSHSHMLEKDRNFGGSLGAVYEIAKNHSIGAEFEYWRNSETGPNNTYTDFTSGGELTRTDSRYGTSNKRQNYSATFNYIWKIDTLGSTVKVLADYTRRDSGAGNDNASRITSPASVVDSVYRDNSSAVYNVTTATLALDKKLSPKWSVKAGAKYTFNDMHNDALYEYVKDDAWTVNTDQSFAINYTENIGAGYGIVAANLNRWSIVAGLRGEYTYTYGKGSEVGQDYFSLFPNGNVSYALSKDGSYSIIAQYARTIERPRFWALNPQRMQISDYTYQTGNPSLDPAYKNDVSLTLVMKHKYTLTAGMTIETDPIEQTIVADPADPNLLCLTTVNYDNMRNYYLSANAPVQIAKWWSLNANLTYIYKGQRLDQHTPEVYSNVVFANASTTFTLPAKFYIDLSYRYMSRYDLGNCWAEPRSRMNAGLKKKFGDNFTATFTVRNIFNDKERIGAAGAGFVRNVVIDQPWNNRSYQIGVTYNFKTGKAFKKKAVEAGSEAEKSRL